MDASWESTSPLCQPVRVAANRARVTHLWRLFSMAASLKDDSNAGQGSTCVCSPKETKNRLCALLYIHTYIHNCRPCQGRGSFRCLCTRHSWAQPVRSCPSFSKTVFTWLSPWSSVSTQANVSSGLRMIDVAEDRWVCKWNWARNGRIWKS